VRQWVLTLPLRLRYRLAWDHDLCRAVVGVFVRAVSATLRRRAAWDGLAGGRSGAVTILQRFGGALNLNVHLHTLVLDGCYTQDAAGRLAFHPVGDFTALDVAETLQAAQVGIARLLDRWRRDDAGWMDEAPATGALAAASVQGLAALGGDGGQPVARLGVPRDDGDEHETGEARCHARWDGFDLDASHVVPAGARDRLERLCRYVLRPPVVSERLHRCDDGQVLWRLPRSWRDGTTHVRFDPCDFLGRLAALVPRPRVNLLFYHGVLGARSAWRRAIVPGGTADVGDGAGATTPERPPEAATTPRRRQWADLMRRSFGFDVLACDRCGGRLRLIALIRQAEVIGRILTHLGVPAELPTPRPARSPPHLPVFADN
jgi:catechol 2,3-dioxygenase-like lactoylglutathione lyase family enzyme